jgi:hypothetical protein
MELPAGRISKYMRAALSGGWALQAQGGYLLRIESLKGLGLAHLAREALAEDKGPQGSSLVVSVHPRRKVVRLAYEGPLGEERQGARWYGEHLALPRLLSQAARVTVHAYVYDPGEYEEVLAFGAGRHVGGDRLLYDEVELPEEQLDDVAFARLQSRWPLGHLAYVFGLQREQLLQLPQVQQVRVALDGTGTEGAVEELLSE